MNTQVLTSKLDEIRHNSKRLRNRRYDEGSARLSASLDRLADQMQKRYNITRDKAELTMSRFLDQYDHKVYELVQSLPGDLDRRVIRYPWAAIATMLGVGLLVGFITKPGR
jgi:ElaB/YqjD/DUF883 family membrane-anchored ribosome-binding protein